MPVDRAYDQTNILLIEDTPSDAELVRAYLEENTDQAFHVIHAPDMESAMRIMTIQKIHAVMLDLFLPDTEDLGGLNSVRTMLPSVPILILTGRDDEEIAFRAVETGAQDYLLKDRINPKMLGRSIRYAMQRKRYEDRITYQAHFDALTGLPNRLQFKERFEIALARLQRSHLSLALMMVDLNGFKHINDTFGHESGDLVLREMGRRLPKSLRPYDLAARYGGDEFLVLIEDVNRAEDLFHIARKIIKLVEEPIKLNLTRVSIGASIGIALSSADDTLCVDMILHRADEAMYLAKKEKHSAYYFYGATTGAGR